MAKNVSLADKWAWVRPSSVTDGPGDLELVCGLLGPHCLPSQRGDSGPCPQRCGAPPRALWSRPQRRVCSLLLEAHGCSPPPGPLRPAALRRTMNEVKECLRSIEQKYKLFQQQQFTFIAALEHCRENAHDKIRPIASIEQVPPRGPPGPSLVRTSKQTKLRPGEGTHVGARLLTSGASPVPSRARGANSRVVKAAGSRPGREGPCRALGPAMRLSRPQLPPSESERSGARPPGRGSGLTRRSSDTLGPCPDQTVLGHTRPLSGRPRRPRTGTS